MTFEKIRLERRGDVAVVSLHAPEMLNAVDILMIEELDQALTLATEQSRAMVLTGSGTSFCSGANLSAGMPLGDGPEPDYGASLESHMNPMMNRLRDLPIPWISAVRGAAAGVGCSLALAADMVVASEGAYFLQAFVRIGLVPDGGSSHLLARSMSRVQAMEMMLLGERLPAAQAFERGLVNRLVPDNELEEVALALAQRLAAGPTHSYSLIRKLAWQAQDSNWDACLQLERELQRQAGLTHDVGEGIDAFLEKRPARFLGR